MINCILLQIILLSMIIYVKSQQSELIHTFSIFFLFNQNDKNCLISIKYVLNNYVQTNFIVTDYLEIGLIHFHNLHEV